MQIMYVNHYLLDGIEGIAYNEQNRGKDDNDKGNGVADEKVKVLLQESDRTWKYDNRSIVKMRNVETS